MEPGREAGFNGHPHHTATDEKAAVAESWKPDSSEAKGSASASEKPELRDHLKAPPATPWSEPHPSSSGYRSPWH